MTEGAYESSHTSFRGPLGDFVNAHRESVSGVLHGFDRVRVQASLRTLYSQSVMEYYLLSQKLLFKDFKSLVTSTTEKVRQAASVWRSVWVIRSFICAATVITRKILDWLRQKRRKNAALQDAARGLGAISFLQRRALGLSWGFF